MAEVYSLDGNLKPIMRGDAPLPNVEPIVGDLAAQMLSNFGTVRDGVVLLVDGKKHWAAKYFLDRGQGGQLYGSGMVAWTEWSVERKASVATGLKFAICKHTPVAGVGANPRRGWHPASCSKCGLDLTVDSGD